MIRLLFLRALLEKVRDGGVLTESEANVLLAAMYADIEDDGAAQGYPAFELGVFLDRYGKDAITDPGHNLNSTIRGLCRVLLYELDKI